MSEIELSYEELRKQMVKELINHRLLVLATSDGESITARSVRCSPDDLTIYVNTHRNSNKCKQIEVNPKVALADANLQIEAVAQLKGKVLDKENAGYLESFKRVDPERYKIWEDRGHFTNPNTRIIEIKPTKMSLYVSGVKPEDTSIDVLDVTNKKAYKRTRKGETTTF